MHLNHVSFFPLQPATSFCRQGLSGKKVKGPWHRVHVNNMSDGHKETYESQRASRCRIQKVLQLPHHPSPSCLPRQAGLQPPGDQLWREGTGWGKGSQMRPAENLDQISCSQWLALMFQTHRGEEEREHFIPAFCR